MRAANPVAKTLAKVVAGSPRRCHQPAGVWDTAALETRHQYLLWIPKFTSFVWKR